MVNASLSDLLWGWCFHATNQGRSAGVKLCRASLCWLRIELREIYLCGFYLFCKIEQEMSCFGVEWKLTNLPILNLDCLHAPKRF